MSKSFSPAERERIERLIADGKTDSEIAFFTGRSATQIASLRVTRRPVLGVRWP
ncbi:MAG: hypothetical protein JOZ16_08650 [Methylobacteriaceae bacterium]|nr:hypothetical protein [Methylobacteriaceae bacterium]